jgi:phosphoribosylglycinamide formyltransferase-1
VVDMSVRRKLGVLISGRGSNLAALIQACNAPHDPAEIAVVISNRPAAPGLQFASDAGIPTQVIDHKKFASRAAFDRALDDALRAAGVDLVCNAGFMRLLTPDFVEAWRDRQLNIHPSLLPAFRGLDTHERAIAAGVRISGCTVHFVRAEMDEGPIVAQAAVPVLPGDDAEALAARVLRAEHRLYPWAVRLVASGAAWVEAEGVVYAPDVPQPEGVTLFAPALDGR